MNSNNQIVLLVGILIAAGVLMIAAPRLQACFFTKGQICDCSRHSFYSKDWSGCDIKKVN